MCLYTLQVGSVSDCVIRRQVRACERKAQAADREIMDLRHLLQSGTLSDLESVGVERKLSTARRAFDRWRLEAARLESTLPAHDSATADQAHEGVAWWTANWHKVETENSDFAAFQASATLQQLTNRVLGYEPLEGWECREILFGDAITEQVERHFDRLPAEFEVLL